MLVAGFVLVGGRSLRMGRDKARLPINSHLLVEDVAAKVGFVSQSVALVGELQHYRDVPFDFVNDLRPSLGPLAGIEAALASGRVDATSSQPSTTVNAFDTSCRAPARSASCSDPLGGGTLTGAPERFTRKPYYARRVIASSFPSFTQRGAAIPVESHPRE